MPQTGSAGFRRSRDDGAPPPPIVAFDPVGDIHATDNRAAARAALAESFAAQFGVDEAGPSAETLADRFGFRYEHSVADPLLPTGRRTVTITGRGSTRAVAPAERTIAVRASRGGSRAATRHGGAGHRAPARRATAPELRVDRVALIAVVLGLVLAFLAATSAHAAVWAGVAPPH